MNPNNTQLGDLSRTIFSYEASKSRDPVDLSAAINSVCQQLRNSLDPLIGGGGFRAVISRSVYLTTKDFSWMQGITLEPGPNCNLEGVGKAVEGVDASEAKRGLEAVVTNILVLLATFIGEDIVLRLIRDIWPWIRN